MNSTLKIYIANLSEDVWPFISAISDAQSKVYEIEENANLCDRDLFTHANEDNVLMILPQSINPDFLDYYFSIFPKKNFQIYSTRVHTGELCVDILKDTKILHILEESFSKSSKVVITSYTSSNQFYNLLNKLKEKHPNIVTPESPKPQSAWTVNFFGSKSGIRQLSQIYQIQEPDFKMASGLICMGIIDAAKIASKMYLEHQGVVIKTNKGHAGAGMLIFHPHSLPADYFSCEITIREQLNKQKYWSQFPIVIEQYIHSNSNIGGGFPNVEFKIHKNGRVDFLYECSMRLDNQGVFKGVEISANVFNDQIRARIIDTGFFLGEKLSAQGYRGYYELDFIAAKNNELYVTESNIRRTGGTHVYQTALKLFGEDFLHKTYILSENLYHLPENGGWTFQHLFQKLKPILFNKSHKEGLFITSVNLLKQGNFGYIIFGKNKKRAGEMEAEMEKLLRKH